MYNPIEGTGDGSAPVVNLTWPFLSRDHIKATVDDVLVEFTWTGASQVTLDAAVAVGATWKVSRETPREVLLVDFSDGAVLLADDLDAVGQQLLYVTQEVLSQVADLEDLDLTEVLSRVTLVEAGLGDAYTDIAALNAGKADVIHSHEIADVTGLQAALDAISSGNLAVGDLIAGANVTITDNGDGTVTIASTGGGGGGATLADGDYGDVAVSATGTVMTVQTVGGVTVAPATHTHDDRYYTDIETDALLSGKSDTGHTHDTRYYTEAEVDGLLAAKADAAHDHDDRYYTEAEVDGLLDGKTPAFTPITAFAADRTLTDADNNAYLKATGAVALDVTLGDLTDGFSAILVNRSSQTLSLAASAGMFKNAATASATSGSIAAGGSVVLFHEGAGVWAVRVDVT